MNNQFRNRKEVITMYLSYFKWTLKGYYVQVYTNKFNNLHETDEFIEKYY